MQNDVVMEGGAFAASGSPIHCREQNAISNASRLAAAARARGIPVIHVWFVVEAGCPGVTMNAPLFEGLADASAMVRGSWGAAPVQGLEAQSGDHIVEKQRMSAWEGTRLETVLKALRRDIVIVTGAWTNMSIEHTSRTGADKGYYMVVPEDCCSTMNAEWHTASVNYALQNVAVVTDSRRFGRVLVLKLAACTDQGDQLQPSVRPCEISKTTPCKVAWCRRNGCLGRSCGHISTRRANQGHDSTIA